MKEDGRVGHDFQAPTMACEDNYFTQDPFEEAWDDVSGSKLDPDMVRKARHDECRISGSREDRQQEG